LRRVLGDNGGYCPPSVDHREQRTQVRALRGLGGSTKSWDFNLLRASEWPRIWPVLLLTTFSLLCASQPEGVLARDAGRSAASQARSSVASAATGQIGALHSNTAQTALAITATIMPVVVTPQPTSQSTSAKDLLIYLPSHPPQTEVTTEWRPLPENAGTLLKTITVVSR